jgi:transcriptional regulator with XRE-family HTH domain
LHLSVRALARSSGVSHSQILRIESGEFDCLTSSFVRLCAAMGIPFADLLERCVLPELMIYKNAVDSELVNFSPDDKNSQEAFADLVFGASIIFSYLVRTSSPVAMAHDFLYPSIDIEERFVQIARQLESRPMDVSQRYIFLNLLQQNPAATLNRFFGFPSRQELENHIVLREAKNPISSIPWMPERCWPSIRAWDSQGWLGSEEKINREIGLTGSSPKGKVEGVKSEIQKLIDQVKRKASGPGAKSQLARTLGVSPARISEWLSGKKEPGGDYALRLQKWVELKRI